MSLEIVSSVRANFPTPLGVQHPEFLTQLVKALGPNWGLLRKSGGTRIGVAGVDVSQDCVTDRAGIQVDCLVDGEGRAIPTWSPVEPEKYTADPARFYRPAAADTDPTPVPKLPVEADNLEPRVEELEETLAQFAIASVQATHQLDTNIANLDERLRKVEGLVNSKAFTRLLRLLNINLTEVIK